MTTITRILERRSFESRAVVKILMILVGLMVFASVFSEGVFLQPRNIVNLIL